MRVSIFALYRASGIYNFGQMLFPGFNICMNQKKKKQIKIGGSESESPEKMREESWKPKRKNQKRNFRKNCSVDIIFQIQLTTKNEWDQTVTCKKSKWCPLPNPFSPHFNSSFERKSKLHNERIRPVDANLARSNYFLLLSVLPLLQQVTCSIPSTAYLPFVNCKNVINCFKSSTTVPQSTDTILRPSSKSVLLLPTQWRISSCFTVSSAPLWFLCQ